jgi:BirA family biotin operon repressor/biotin-[acetyl-CoA-carboxylase] ligase
MHMPLSHAMSPGLEWRESCASTNSEWVGRAARLDDLAVLATADQTAGRGRLDRVWAAPAGTALAVSVLVRRAPDAVAAPDPRRLGWLPLIAGVAMCRAVRSLGVSLAAVKWPNDVLVDDRKLSGILTELCEAGVVIGAGLNVSMSTDDLPVPTATSLVLEGVVDDAQLLDRALAAYLAELLPLVELWRSTAALEQVRDIVQSHLQTLGRAVRVDRPGMPALVGTAIELDGDGRLMVQPAGHGSAVVAVAAGDITHLRYE